MKFHSIEVDQKKLITFFFCFFDQCISGRVIFKFDSRFVHIIGESAELTQNIFSIRELWLLDYSLKSEVVILMNARIITIGETDGIVIFLKSNRFGGLNSFLKQWFCNLKGPSAFGCSKCSLGDRVVEIGYLE